MGEVEFVSLFFPLLIYVEVQDFLLESFIFLHLKPPVSLVF